jgi:hypothetical protein
LLYVPSTSHTAAPGTPRSPLAKLCSSQHDKNGTTTQLVHSVGDDASPPNEMLIRDTHMDTRGLTNLVVVGETCLGRMVLKYDMFGIVVQHQDNTKN